MNDFEWAQLIAQEKEYNKITSNPLFDDKYDDGGNEISIGDVVSSTYTYRLATGVLVPLEGRVTSISPDGVKVRIQNRPNLSPLAVPGGALKVVGKEEINSAANVWRMQNVFGEGPYHMERKLSPGEQPGDVRGILYKDYEGLWESNLDLFLHLSPREDLSIGIKLFGWLAGEPINKHERFAYNVETSKMLFGFLSEAQADAWFPEAIRKALSCFGYSLCEVQAARVIAKSGHQCVYLPV